MSEDAFDVGIVGAGVVGCSTAYALSTQGYTVCVVDRGRSPGGGSTSASSAVIRFNYSTWEGVATSWEAHHAWQQWADFLGGADDAGMAQFVRTGGLTLDSPGQDRRRVLALFDRAGVPYQEWDPQTIRRCLPIIDPGRHFPPKPITDDAFWEEADGELGGYWTPDAGFIDDPQLATHNLMTAATRSGAKFHFRSQVQQVLRNKDRVSGLGMADGRVIKTRVVVNAAGPHSSAINALAGVGDDFHVHTRPMRQEVHEVPAPEGYSRNGTPGPLVADPDLGVYFRGTPSGGLLVGGTEPECDTLEWLDDPDRSNPMVTKNRYEAQVYRAARRIPTLHVPNAPNGVSGVYDVTEDWIPIYDKTALNGYYVAIGTSGNQFKNGPIIGTLMSSLIEACENGTNHDHDPVHTRLPLTNHDVDLSHYSRLRQVHDGSSFSVMG